MGNRSTGKNVSALADPITSRCKAASWWCRCRDGAVGVLVLLLQLLGVVVVVVVGATKRAAVRPQMARTLRRNHNPLKRGGICFKRTMAGGAAASDSRGVRLGANSSAVGRIKDLPMVVDRDVPYNDE